MRRHWSRGSTGNCEIPGCSDEPGTLLHLATGQCPSLTAAKSKVVLLWKDFLTTNPVLFPLVSDISLGDQSHFLSFLVDPSTNPSVISLIQTNKPELDLLNKLFYLTRTWLYTLHKERLSLLGLWVKI